MGAEDMDSYVFCLAQKKTAMKVSKEMTDIMTFCPEKRPAQDRYVLNTQIHKDLKNSIDFSFMNSTFHKIFFPLWCEIVLLPS